jgi:hypothetical protein
MLIPAVVLALSVVAGGIEAASVESLALKAKPRAIVVDTMGGRITLVGVPDKVVQQLAAQSTLCPTTERMVDDGPLQLRCRSRRVVAELNGATLQLRSVQTTPLTTDASRAPKAFYNPELYSLGGPCPGDTPSSRGECAMARGAVVEAALAFRDAWRAPEGHHAHAALRLGDLAWMAGDLESAAGWYDRSGAGVFARLAAARLCELTTACLDGPVSRLHFDPWDQTGMPAPMIDESVLRRARAYAFANRLDDAVRLLLQASSREHSPCENEVVLCRKIATEALHARRGRDAPGALALAMSLNKPFEGEGAVELAREVVAQVDHLGAPVYAASVLAAVTAVVPKNELPSHLAATAEHYLAASDIVRADIVIAFARSRGLQKGKRWQAISALRRAVEAGNDAQAVHGDDARTLADVVHTDARDAHDAGHDAAHSTPTQKTPSTSRHKAPAAHTAAGAHDAPHDAKKADEHATPEVKKADAKKADAKKADAKKADAKKADAKKPDEHKPDEHKPDEHKPEAKKPEAKKPEADGVKKAETTASASKS